MKTQKETSLKKGLFILLLAFLIAITGFGYYKYVQYTNWRAKAIQAIDKLDADRSELEALQVLQSDLKTEADRCKDFISQQQGEFGEFQYCQYFIKWSEKTL